MFSFSNKLYPITDTRISQRSHANQVAQLSEGGARLIQVREKYLAPRDFFREAEAAVARSRAAGTRIIINDRADIALALRADGVHLGQDDLPPDAARRLLGPNAIIGFSTHNPVQAKLAAQLPVSYVAIGPIFATNTKCNPDAIVGIEGLRRVRDAVGDIALVAIGGITIENAAAVISAGADAVAVIGALFREELSISENARRLLQVLDASQTS